VALVFDCGYNSVGIRLDSGDLAYLSMECASFLQILLKVANTNPFSLWTWWR
jgi:nicotinic acid phosphoribosyltransferase